MITEEYQRRLFEHADKLGYIRRDVAAPVRGWTAGSPEYLLFHHPASDAHAVVAATPSNPRSISSAKKKLQSELNRALGITPRKKRASRGKLDGSPLVDEPPDIFWALTLLRMVRNRRAGPFPRGANFDTETIELSYRSTCANCGETVMSPSPYCSDFCGQLSGTIRYVRKAASEGRLDRADFQLGLGTRLIAQFKGGYPTKARRLTRQRREIIFERDNRTCQVCGGPADQVDHISGASGDTSNLRAICGPCNRTLAMTNTREPSDGERAEFLAHATDICSDMATRIAAPRACRACDDHERWNGRQPQIRAARRERLKKIEEDAESDFEDIDGYLWHAMQKDD